MFIPVMQPAIMEEESVLGYLQRLAIVSSDRAMKPLIQTVVGHRYIQAPWLLPTNLELISKNLQALPDAKELLCNHTIFPSIAQFITEKNRERLTERMLQGKGSATGLYLLLGLAHSLSNSIKVYQTYCEDCEKADKQTHGFAFWKRHHQFPYVLTCGLHGTMLRTGSGCCPVTQRAGNIARLPGVCCTCAESTRYLSQFHEVDNQALEKDRQISQILYQGLKFEWPAFASDKLGLFYRYSFIEKGFVKGRYVASPALTEKFESFFGAQLLDSYASRTLPATGWVAEAARGRAPRSAIRNALLINFLFGGLDEFAERIKLTDWQKITLPRQDTRPIQTISEPSCDVSIQERIANRERLTSWISTQTSPTRTAAQKNIPWVVKWLRKYDSDWYKLALPAIPPQFFSDQTTAHWKSLRIHEDLAAFDRVSLRYQALTDPSLEPTLVTRPRLMEGLATKQIIRPLTDKLIAILVDSPRSYRERRAVWLFLHPERAPESMSSLEYAYSKTRIGKGRIVQLEHEGAGRPAAIPNKEDLNRYTVLRKNCLKVKLS